ncbi:MULTISPECIES: porin [Thalassotalea]|uniref:Porin n=1 Tax=Thalassotalea castellviae TaxID=3075612 RepID=A0ABU2ZYH8_9GAMM|nr:porin [Thalassotalea sp. W431]MDT0602967.1 porin [Thalassotalea sp. W431]
MKLSYSTLATALLATLSVSSLAADVTIYGKANVSVQSSDEGEGSFTEVKSNASRIGFKGTHELSDDLTVVYKAEFQVDLDGDSAKGDSITDRNQYIGLKGNFGQVLLGNNDTVLKQSQGKVDLFSDLNGDIKSLWKGENRMSDSITYKSKSFNHFQVGVTYVVEDSVDGDDATSFAVTYGDAALKKSQWYAALAFDSEMKGYDVTRATVQGKLAGVTLGAMLQTQEEVSSGKEMDGFLASAKYSIDSWVLKAQLQTANFDGGDDKSGVTLGADYKLAKNTKLYGFYTTFDMDSGADEDYLGAGIEYKF